MCDCHIHINTEVKKRYGIAISCNTKGTYGYVTKSGSIGLVVSLPLVIDEPGLGCAITGQHLISARYCPLCGEKY